MVDRNTLISKGIPVNTLRFGPTGGYVSCGKYTNAIKCAKTSIGSNISFNEKLVDKIPSPSSNKSLKNINDSSHGTNVSNEVRSSTKRKMYKRKIHKTTDMNPVEGTQIPSVHSDIQPDDERTISTTQDTLCHSIVTQSYANDVEKTDENDTKEDIDIVAVVDKVSVSDSIDIHLVKTEQPDDETADENVKEEDIVVVVVVEEEEEEVSIDYSMDLVKDEQPESCKQNRGMPIQCQLCNKTFSTTRCLKRHSSRHDNEKACSLCRKVFRFVDDLTRHIETSHPKTTSKISSLGNKYKCKLCGEGFSNMRFLRQHVNAEHKRKQRRYTCLECSKTFPYLHTYNKHKKLHTKNEHEYSCSECPTKCPTLDLLRTHMKTHPNGGKLYQCNECEKRFEQPYNLRRHILTHKKDRRFECNICHTFFSRRDNLKTHIRRHSDVNNRQFECDICHHFFSRQDNLKKHIVRHSGANPYTCDLCGAGFRHSTIMDKHKLQNHK